ncbi:phosphodiesterase [Dactylosporangium vinaceum]|uniref:Phosphodiesterase n=1 Tax=Dactylosporangium vinaceum TaxID=53362 RepID=A0ABV5MG61_9ACTN|nr:phosphodiesterase [Dactylosporangium vinaceum]UAB98971.1 phosphodiesterase [Dactylosporangium vinaceum]
MPLIAHLSDPHITTGALAAEPAAGLYRALTRVLALEPRPDCVIVTGDLVDHGRPEEYAVLRELIEHFPAPVHLVPGNHDARAALQQAFELDETFYAAEYDAFSVVVLDSLNPELGDAGILGSEQLAWLDQTLQARPEVPAFVCLHHPPVRVGIPGMDAIRLVDGPELAEVVRRHPHVARVLAGHLHRVVTAGFAGTILSVAPSTYRQVDLGMRADRPVSFVAEPSGFLLHRLEGSECVTHLVQVSHTGAPVTAY